MLKNFAVAVAVSLAASGSLCVAEEHPAPITAFPHVRLLDGTDAPPIFPATVLIQGDKILAVGPESLITIPPGATLIAAPPKTNYTLMPGIISDHSHLGVTDGTTSFTGTDTKANILRQLRQYEVYGVTTVTSLGLNSENFYALRPLMHEGRYSGADIFGADHGLGFSDLAPPMPMGPDNLDRPNNADQARADVDAAASRKTDLIKFWFDDFLGSFPRKMPEDVYTAIIDEAHAKHLRVAAHIYYLPDAQALADAGVDIIAHGIRNQPVSDAFVHTMLARGTWYIPTLSLDESFYIYADAQPWMKQPFFQHSVQPALQAQFDDPEWRKKTNGEVKLGVQKAAVAINQKNLKTLFDAGVKIGFGTDSGATPLRIPGFAEHRELKLMVDAGLTPQQAISVATRNAAALLGLTDRGTLVPGKKADFLVLTADPSTNITNTQTIRQVWHRGKQVAGTLDAFNP